MNWLTGLGKSQTKSAATKEYEKRKKNNRSGSISGAASVSSDIQLGAVAPPPPPAPELRTTYHEPPKIKDSVYASPILETDEFFTAPESTPIKPFNQGFTESNTIIV